VVFVWRCTERIELVPCRMPLVHYDYRNPGRRALLLLASLSLFPFGKQVRYGGGAASFLLNIVWLLFSGLFLALEHVLFGVLLCITVIGIPFGLQQFKLAKLALMPFGAEVY